MDPASASERSAAELAQACPLLGEFGTRFVLQTADEDQSVALLGMPGAEELGPGGQLLLRVEGRMPVQVHGFRVTADHLARLVKLMDQRPSFGSSAVSVPTQPVEPPAAEPTPERDVEERAVDTETEVDGVSHLADAGEAREPGHTPKRGLASELVPGASARAEGAMDSAEPPVDEDSSESPESAVGTVAERGEHSSSAADGTAAARCLASPLLRKLNTAPLRIRCFGTRQVWLPG